MSLKESGWYNQTKRLTECPFCGFEIPKDKGTVRVNHLMDCNEAPRDDNRGQG